MPKVYKALSAIEQIEIQKELDDIIEAIDDEMVCCHIGVFNRGDDPRVALNKLMKWSEDTGAYFATHPQKGEING